MAIAFLGYFNSLTCFQDLNNENVCILSISVVTQPSSALKCIIDKYNLNPEYILESNNLNLNTKIQSIKKLLNSFAGIYICINKMNGHMYVGSASLNNMYRRYRGHIHLSIGGSLLVNRAIIKYGIENFSFIVIETFSKENSRNKDHIIAAEQRYIDELQPVYNIAKIAGSVLGTKRSAEYRIQQSLNVSPEQIERIRNMNLNKKFTAETRKLLREAALTRQYSEETRLKMSANNNKSVPFTAYYKDSNIVYLEFASIAEASLHFFNDAGKRYPIKKALSNNTLLLDKYTLTRL